MSQIVLGYTQEPGFEYGPVLSQIAALLAGRGQRVLVVDAALDPAEQSHRISGLEAPGLLNLLMDQREAALRGSATGPDWRACLLRPSSLMGAHLLPAGHGRAEDVQSPFNWDAFYSHAGGGKFLEGLRDAWVGEFDTVLLHCPPRSGARDICMVQMADILVLGFPLELASAKEAGILVQQAQTARQRLVYDRLSLLVFPMPWLSRDEVSRVQWEECAKFLASCYRSWLPEDRRPWQALESAHLKANTRLNDASCLLASRLIEQGFRNAAEWIPLPETSSSAPRVGWSKSLNLRPEHFASTLEQGHELQITLTQDIGLQEASTLVAETIDSVRRKVDSGWDKLITFAVEEGVEIDEQACDALVQSFRRLAEEGCSVVIKGPGLVQQLGIAAFTPSPRPAKLRHLVEHLPETPDLAATFLAHAKVRLEPSPDSSALNRFLLQTWESARARWPTVMLAPELFVRHLAERLPGLGPVAAVEPLLEQLSLAELYLACACLHEVPLAVERFEQHYLKKLPKLLGQRKQSAATLDETCRLARVKILVPTPEGPPKIAEYAGQGSLLAWVRIIAARIAIKLSAHQEPAPEPYADTGLSVLAEPGTALSMDFIKPHHREDLRQAMREAFASLSSEDRHLLRLYFVDQLSMYDLVPLLRVSQPTISRRLKSAKEKVYTETRRHLQTRLGLSPQDFQGFMMLLDDQLEVRISQLFGEEDPLSRKG